VTVSVTSPVVLIVEDHPDSLDMYALGLKLLGFEPITASSAEQGFASACAYRPAVVVVDVWLPRTSGLDLVRRLRSDARTRHTAIVAITGDPLDATRRQASEAGCDRFLVKPCAPDELARELEDLLGSRGLPEAVTHEPTPVEPVEDASYAQALQRIRAEYLEMPAMRLTPEQVQRLCGLNAGVCQQVLDALVRIQFLRTGADGLYTRATNGALAHPSGSRRSAPYSPR
jgi:DNA-binding response OmpR family regulator